MRGIIKKLSLSEVNLHLSPGLTYTHTLTASHMFSVLQVMVGFTSSERSLLPYVSRVLKQKVRLPFDFII